MAEFLPIYLLPGRYGWKWGIQEDERNTHFPIGVVTNWDEFAQCLEGVEYDYHRTEGLWQIRKTIYQSPWPEMDGIYPRRDEETDRFWSEMDTEFRKHLQDVITETSAIVGPPIYCTLNDENRFSQDSSPWDDGMAESAVWDLPEGIVCVAFDAPGEEFPIFINVSARRPGFDPYK